MSASASVSLLPGINYNGVQDVAERRRKKDCLPAGVMVGASLPRSSLSCCPTTASSQAKLCAGSAAMVVLT